MKTSICTIVSNNYLGQAITLFKSFNKYNKNIDFNILIVDKNNTEHIELFRDNSLNYYNVNELEINQIDSMAFKYNVTEFNTSVKPFFIEFLYENKNYDKVIYLDPDMMVFNSIDKLIDLLDHNSIILTPHICSDRYDKGTLKDTDFLRNGIYNLGFIATKNDNNTKKMLEWWKLRLRKEAYADVVKGLAWDQKWMDFVPSLFNNVYILKDPGYNMAHWNMHERKIIKIEDIYKVNKDFNLVIFHFSQFKFNNPQYILNEKDFFVNSAKKIRVDEREDLKELYENYYEEVMGNGYNIFSNCKYSYNYYDNGEEILKIHRMMYEEISILLDIKSNPFSTIDENSYYKWLLKEKYIENKKKKMNSVKKPVLNTSNKQVKIVNRALKLCRVILGCEKYCNLLKKINWISSLSNQAIIYDKGDK